MHFVQRIKERLAASDVGQRMARGMFWTFTGSVTAKLMVLVGGILCAHVLGKNAYGEFGVIKSTISTFVAIGSSGLGLTATKYIAEYRKNHPERVNDVYQLTTAFSLCVALLLAALVFWGSGFLATTVFGKPDLIGPVRVSAVILIFTIFNIPQDASLVGFEDFRSVAINTFIGSFIETAGMLVGGYFAGVTGAVAGYGFGFLIQALCNWLSLRRNFSKHSVKVVHKRFSRADFKLLTHYTFPAMLATIITVPVFWLVRILITRACGFGEVAIYEAADQWRLVIVFIPGTISRIVLPILSSIGQGDSKKFMRVMNVNILLNASIATVFFLLVLAFSDVIMNMYGKGFDNSLPLIILAASAIFHSIVNVLGNTISSLARMWTWCGINFVWAFITIAGSYVALRCGWRVQGVAWAILAAYACQALIQYFYVKHIESLPTSAQPD